MVDLRPDGSFPYVRVSADDPLLGGLPFEVAGLIQDARFGDFNNDGLVTLTYSFRDTASTRRGTPNPDLQERIVTILDEITRLTNLRFAEIDQDAAIDFSVESGLAERGFAGFADFPWPSGASASVDDGGPPSNLILIQEILHSLGLQGSEEGFLALPGLLYPADFDNPLWTSLQTEVLDLVEQDSTGLLPLDIEGLIALYGDGSQTDGDDIYRFDTSVFTYEGLHDAGGNDTLIITSENDVDVRIDLSGDRGAIDIGQTILIRSGIFDQYERVGALINTTRFTALENVQTAGGNDWVLGGRVDNDLRGGDGNDSLYGIDGNDTLQGQRGDDMVDGGKGDDLVYGNVGNDLLKGQSGNDVLIGGRGDDVLNGQQGRDNLVGQWGADILDGGSAIDTAGYGQSDAGVLINLITGVASGGHAEGDTLASIEDVEGSNFDDTLTGTQDRNRLNARNGDDYLEGLGGNDLLLSGGGNDTIHAGEGDDLLNGQAGDDTLFGDSGSDVIIGNQGDDILYGGAGHDALSGNAGRDTLDGGLGDDTLTGQQQADVFVYSGGHDLVTDFRLDQGDTLDLTALGYTSIDTALALAQNTEIGVVFTFGEMGTLTLLSVFLEDL